mmetsp:Transcript_27645/g.69255  ORF Transcript_27645/g.69255 Transcript_27645/m.69255 type:complete len:200 (-) Transcript_27645:87-686(-)
MAVITDPTHTIMMHPNICIVIWSRPMATMRPLSTTGSNALSICTNDTERCRYALPPAASDTASSTPIRSIPRLHSTNVKSFRAPSFATPECTSTSTSSQRAKVPPVTMAMGNSKYRVSRTYFCSRMSVGPVKTNSATWTSRGPKPAYASCAAAAIPLPLPAPLSSVTLFTLCALPPSVSLPSCLSVVRCLLFWGLALSL